MARPTTWLLALIVTGGPVLGASSTGAYEQDRPIQAAQGARDDKPKPVVNRPSEGRERWKWWLYDREELRISDQQSAAINEIFEATIPRLREAGQELDRAEKDLSRTIKEHTADLAVVSLQLDRVENARSQHNKMRTLMLYRIHALLTAEQRVKLEAVRARRNQGRGDKPSQPDRGR